VLHYGLVQCINLTISGTRMVVSNINAMSSSRPKYTNQSPVLSLNSLFNDRFMFQ